MNWLSIVSPRYAPASPKDLVAFERELGTELPSDYREFLLTYNGGPVVVEHTLETSIDECCEHTGVSNFFPLTLPNTSPSLGVIEFRQRWCASKVGIEAALTIGDDGGTGYFFMMLSRRFFGRIYFSYKDVFQANSPDWQAGSIAMPGYMGLISRDFSELGQLIEQAVDGSRAAPPQQ